jgi:hypothetical protein
MPVCQALLAGAYDGRFDTPPEEAPMSAIALALFLMLFGVAAFVLAWMHFTQLIFGEKQAEVGFTIVGLLTFIPGVASCRAVTPHSPLQARNHWLTHGRACLLLPLLLVRGACRCLPHVDRAVCVARGPGLQLVSWCHGRAPNTHNECGW